MRRFIMVLACLISATAVTAEEPSDKTRACTQQAQSLTRGAVAWKSSFDATGMAADSSYISELLMAFDVNTAYSSALQALYIGQIDKDTIFDQLDGELTRLQRKRARIIAMLDEAFGNSGDTTRQQEFIISCVAQFAP